MREIHLAETGAGGTGGAQRGLRIGGNLVVSYVPQGTAGLHGSLRALAQREGLDEPLFKAILRKLDFSREQFDKDLETYSEGQKKKVLLAASLCTQAHLYVWDEPLNYIDVFSRMQLEELLRACRPAMLLVSMTKPSWRDWPISASN